MDAASGSGGGGRGGGGPSSSNFSLKYLWSFFSRRLSRRAPKLRRLINSSSASVDGDRFRDFRICLVGAVARCLSRRGGYSGDDSPSVDGGSSFSLPLGGSFDPPSVALSSSRESSCIAMYSLNATSIESSSWDDNFSARFIVADPGFVVFDFVSANESLGL